MEYPIPWLLAEANVNVNSTSVLPRATVTSAYALVKSGLLPSASVLMMQLDGEMSTVSESVRLLSVIVPLAIAMTIGLFSTNSHKVGSNVL
jgi:hypothetical protein